MQEAACFKLTVVQGPHEHAVPCITVPYCLAADGDIAESEKQVLHAQDEACLLFDGITKAKRTPGRVALETTALRATETSENAATEPTARGSSANVDCVDFMVY